MSLSERYAGAMEDLRRVKKALESDAAKNIKPNPESTWTLDCYAEDYVGPAMRTLQAMWEEIERLR